MQGVRRLSTQFAATRLAGVWKKKKKKKKTTTTTTTTKTTTKTKKKTKKKKKKKKKKRKKKKKKKRKKKKKKTRERATTARTRAPTAFEPLLYQTDLERLPRRLARDHLQHGAADAPYVGLAAVARLHHDLGSHKVRCATRPLL